MALGVYEFPENNAQFSTSGTFTNPLTTTIDGVTGGTLDRRFYIRNDSELYSYENVTIDTVSGANITDGGIEDYEWKLIAGDSQPSEAEWEQTVAGYPITLDSIGETDTFDTTTFLPFWLRVSIPKGAPVDSFSHVKLRISASQITIE